MYFLSGTGFVIRPKRFDVAAIFEPSDNTGVPSNMPRTVFNEAQIKLSRMNGCQEIKGNCSVVTALNEIKADIARQ